MDKETKDIKSSKFLIPVSELEGETMIQFSDLSPAEFNLDTKKVKGFRKIDAVVKLIAIPTRIAANFEVDFVVDLACVRCLETFTNECKVNVHLDYVEGKDPFTKIEGLELKASDTDEVYYCGPKIDLAIGIREAIIMSLPIVPLCKDGCLGLCPVCGQNINKTKCGCKLEKVGFFTPKSINAKEMNFNKNRKRRKSKKKD